MWLPFIHYYIEKCCSVQTDAFQCVKNGMLVVGEYCHRDASINSVPKHFLSSNTACTRDYRFLFILNYILVFARPSILSIPVIHVVWTYRLSSSLVLDRLMVMDRFARWTLRWGLTMYREILLDLVSTIDNRPSAIFTWICLLNYTQSILSTWSFSENNSDSPSVRLFQCKTVLFQTNWVHFLMMVAYIKSKITCTDCKLEAQKVLPSNWIHELCYKPLWLESGWICKDTSAY